MPTVNGTTATLAVKYPQTLNGPSTLRTLYALLNEQKSATFILMREILPDTLASTSELEIIFDGSAWEVVQSESLAGSNFLKRFFEIVKHNAAGIRRARTTAGPVFSVTDFFLFKVANCLPDSASVLWENQWALSVDNREELAVTMQLLRESFIEYTKSSTLHKRWALLLMQKATEVKHNEMPETEFFRAASSFHAFHLRKQQECQAAKLRQLVQRYQVEGSAHLFDAIYDDAAVVKVADEYRNYMADPDSYCLGHDVLHTDFIEMIIDNGLEAALEEFAEGAEFPTELGRNILAEFEYFVRMEEC